MNDAYEMPQFKMMNQAYKQYRTSGFTLMTTIITLSTGGFGTLGSAGVSLEMRSLLFIPFTLALLQQLCHYHGEQWHARAAEEAFQYTFQKMNNSSPEQSEAMAAAAKASLLEQMKKIMELGNKSNCWFGCADSLCDWSVGTFLVSTVIILGRVLLSAACA